jgi:glycosyltransferase involved in cell wall biosynthesis
MGYTENCLPKALASLGHDVHLITSNLNVYGNEAGYQRTYQEFLGAADQGVGTKYVDGYVVHRLQSRTLAGYVYLPELWRRIRELNPQIVHSLEIASLQSFALAIASLFNRFVLFAESHQHMSVVRPFLLERKGNYWKKLAFWVTRTVPTALASLRVSRCFAIAPDCIEVARRFYGVPKNKLKLQSLGTDLSVFGPAIDAAALQVREAARLELGFTEHDIVCIYTGRLSVEKDPALLARAIDMLSKQRSRFRGLFVGEGIQRDEIAACTNTTILPFVTHRRLAQLYRLSDIAVWPTQESMSMLDAAASGLPLVVSNRIGESDRIDGNGMAYAEGDVSDLVKTLLRLECACTRKTLGQIGRHKMESKFNWQTIAKSVASDYAAGLRDAAS